MAPEVAVWAEHLRALLDTAAFSKDSDAALALGVNAPDLSKFLAGKKASERAFVRTVHAVCARRRGVAVEDRARQDTDVLYMRALKHLNPQVWELLTAVDERDAAVAREQALQRDLSLLRGWLNRSDDEAARLRRDLDTVREERAALAAKVDGLLQQLRRMEEEAVVAEAVMVAERAAADPEPLAGMDVLIVWWSGPAIALCALVCVAGTAAALIGAPLADNGSSWQAGGWMAAGGAAVVGAATGWLRYAALKRLGVGRYTPSDDLLAVLLAVAAATAPLYMVNMGIRSQQDYLEHRSKVTAAVTDCTPQYHFDQDGNVDSVTYKCTYTWKIAGRTYHQRDQGLNTDKKATVLIDPADPSTMLPDRFGLRAYVWAYLVAAFALALPGGALRLCRNAWQRTMTQKARAAASASTGSSTTSPWARTPSTR